MTIAPSCSLLHVPYEAARETGIARRGARLARLRRREARRAGTCWPGPSSARRGATSCSPPSRERVGVAARLDAHQRPAGARPRRRAVTEADHDRDAPVEERRRLQRARLALPELPTTTIGSFPQTDEIRAARRDLRSGELDAGRLRAVPRGAGRRGRRRPGGARPRRARARRARAQRHGRVLRRAAAGASPSPTHGWVQSYGSRCVKPPILYGDVSRPAPMTVALVAVRPVAHRAAR